MHIEEVAQLTLDLSKRCAEDTLLLPLFQALPVDLPH